jgi:hypothetical protein
MLQKATETDTKSMTNAEKWDRIRQSLQEHPEWSDRQHAKALGVDHKTVGSVRAAELPHPDLVVELLPGKIRALADLVITRGNVEYFYTAGSWIPAELAHLPRRAA